MNNCNTIDIDINNDTVIIETCSNDLCDVKKMWWSVSDRDSASALSERCDIKKKIMSRDRWRSGIV